MDEEEMSERDKQGDKNWNQSLKKRLQLHFQM